MRAAVNMRYGGPEVISVREIREPEPGAGEVLVRVRASTVNRTDCGYLRAHPFFIRAFSGLRYPKHKVRGMDFAGEVESIGEGVTSFALGDRVFGLAPTESGAHAEYLLVPEDGAIVTMPPGLAFHEAVVAEGALYANNNLKAFELALGDTILIYGASGAIGTSAVQLAKSYGAEVTAVVATRHLELARSLGADHVVDYTAEDFTAIGRTFDYAFDAVGKTSYFQCRRLLKPGGIFSATDLGPWGSNVLLPLWGRIRRRRRVVFPVGSASKDFMKFLKARMEAGEFRAVIDRRYPLDQIADAYRYVLTGKKTGVVAIDIAPEESA